MSRQAKLAKSHLGPCSSVLLAMGAPHPAQYPLQSNTLCLASIPLLPSGNISQISFKEMTPHLTISIVSGLTAANQNPKSSQR